MKQAEFLIGNKLYFLYQRPHNSLKKQPLENECSVFTLENIYLNSILKSKNDFQILGFIENKEKLFEISSEYQITTFSCFDNVTLYFLDISQDKIYYVKFHVCKKSGNHFFQGYQIEPFNPTNIPSNLVIEINIRNLREGYHYNFDNIVEEKEKSSVFYNNLEIEFWSRECPICFIKLRNIINLNDHINMSHVVYASEIRNNKIYIKDFIPESSNLQMKFDMKNLSDSKSEECALKEAFNFLTENEGFQSSSLSDLSEDNSCLEYYTNKYVNNNGNLLESKMKTPRLVSFSTKRTSLNSSSNWNYQSTLDLFDLVKKLKNSKEIMEISALSKASNNINTIFYLKNSLNQASNVSLISLRRKIFENFITFPQDILNTNEIVQTAQSNFVFYKRRNTNLIDYPLKNYSLLIEWEYRNLDYSILLSKHLNSNLNDLQTSEKEMLLMKTWNYYKIKHINTHVALFNMLQNERFSNETVRFIELITNRGIISSREVAKILLRVFDSFAD